MIAVAFNIYDGYCTMDILFRILQGKWRQGTQQSSIAFLCLPRDLARHSPGGRTSFSPLVFAMRNQDCCGV